MERKRNIDRGEYLQKKEKKTGIFRKKEKMDLFRKKERLFREKEYQKTEI